ncbi:tetratricopeptide repeat protein [Cupriavidus pinatubonensis]|uniref:tetratricopeptide repeat protein n=1 Tax=Cupriavidus pinatubonensis TaxID=248026 RepID=UPI001CC55E79|nr:tetratricopeptide repeat protein [Cupriavidus pinatubonensis]
MLLRVTLALAYQQQGELTAAVPHVVKATELNPHYSGAWRALGVLYVDLGQDAKARVAFQKGIEAARDHGDKQVEKEMIVRLRRLERQSGGDGPHSGAGKT